MKGNKSNRNKGNNKKKTFWERINDRINIAAKSGPLGRYDEDADMKIYPDDLFSAANQSGLGADNGFKKQDVIYPEDEFNKVLGGFETQAISDHSATLGGNVSIPADESVGEARDWVNFNQK